MQISVLGKGLVRPWKCMVVILGLIGEPLVRKKRCGVQGYDGKGKPHGCLEPMKAVTKGKPHVFENQSDDPKLNRRILTYTFFLDLVLVNTSWSIELAVT
jgi:hypothetical protein